MNNNNASANPGRFGMQLARPLALLVLSGMFLAQPLLALDTDFEVEVVAFYSDNVTRVDPSRDIDGVVTTAGFTLNLEEQSRRLDLIAHGGLLFATFPGSTFDDETLGLVTASALIRISEQNFSWFFAENLGQVVINPFQAETPDNRESMNFFTTGPRLSLPLGSRTKLNLEGNFSDVQYEERPLDNQRFGGSIGFERELSRNRSLSFIVDGERIEYDDAPPNAPVDQQSAYLRLQTAAARSQLSLSLGWNQVERAGNKGDGLLAELDWSRQVSAISTFSFHFGTRFSDAGDIFRFIQSIDSRRAGTQDIQTVNDPFQLDTVSIAYTLNKPRTRLSIDAFYEKENYESRTDLDRDRSGIKLDLTRNLTRSLNATLFTNLSYRDYDNTTRNDDDSIYGFRLRWDISHRLGLNLTVQRIERDSSDALFNFVEKRASLSLLFRSGQK